MTGSGGSSASEGEGTAPSPPVRIGEIIAGKYSVERLLGVGAMGVVVSARHIDLHELRAIKLMLPSMLGDVEGVERFLREARAVSKLRSQHVAAVFDVGRLETGAPYIVMEHLEGADLKSVLSERGVLTPSDAAAYISEACEALAEAHAAGIIHRDIKPANLFVAARRGAAPTIKLLDFGIAKMAAAPGDVAALEMTKTKEILGTPLYMAPEQMRSMRNADARSDVWSLGVILYRALTGKVPFDGQSLTEVCVAVLTDTPVRPSALRPDLPPGLDAVILGCLEKDPARRIGSAAELAIALAPFVIARPRAPLQSFTAEPSVVLSAPPPVIVETTDVATLVWKTSAPSSAPESRDLTTSQASWAQTGKRAPPRSSRIGIAVAASAVGVALALVAGVGLFAHRRAAAPSSATELAPPASQAVAAPSASIAALPSAAPPADPAPPARPMAAPTAVASATPPPRASASVKVAAPIRGGAFVGRY